MKLYMEGKNHPDTVSRNTVGEIVGQTSPEEVSNRIF